MLLCLRFSYKENNMWFDSIESTSSPLLPSQGLEWKLILPRKNLETESLLSDRPGWKLDGRREDQQIPLAPPQPELPWFAQPINANLCLEPFGRCRRENLCVCSFNSLLIFCTKLESFRRIMAPPIFRWQKLQRLRGKQILPQIHCLRISFLDSNILTIDSVSVPFVFPWPCLLPSGM